MGYAAMVDRPHPILTANRVYNFAQFSIFDKPLRMAII
jgi:hypothetical protein